MHELVITIAKYFIVISVVASLLVWLRLSRADKRRFIIVAIIGAILSLLLAKIGSKLFYDPRPFVAGHFTPYFPHGNDNGFPSDHTLFTSFLAFLVMKFNCKAGIALLVVAALVGVSRRLAGVHHLVDIIGSMVFAAIGVGLAILAVNFISNHRTPSNYEQRRKPQA
jgi:undecaprenyl-diphosphatase